MSLIELLIQNFRKIGSFHASMSLIFFRIFHQKLDHFSVENIAKKLHFGVWDDGRSTKGFEIFQEVSMSDWNVKKKYTKFPQGR